ncbi:IMP cyclohydrolase [Halogeometricum borinquense DSM 11551]|uniref:IMP cyclohydrolase n=2 Tax=Halogeometricum borinquense TaxID=60847 RepID=E4NSU3_HALBP|nr:IMP cyclohydrolase [Halogeometricum borinquense]ADQ65831.1 IMP cyclohydrolase [Halogeometricum borinquense DSM 11551]ELY26833.1 IMP cyclohydrolase [Halogeometricum borinquense DSM 11551]RYJ14898.1 IMP cyclohydrolase [Halogeometricum borinquense]
MYVGRFIVIGPDFGAYRVSSRSFPNRQVVERDGTLTVAPTPDAPETDNPYISYNCVREGGDSVVVGNGSHVDPIAEKLDLGYPARDALAESLLAMDYEKDDYDTPRIAGVVGEESYIGIVRRDALLVRPVTENPMLVATYEEDDPAVVVFDGDGSPAELAERAYEMDYEHAVCAAGVTYDDGDVDVGFYNDE